MSKEMSTFETLVEDQFVYGGQKYANSDTKEVTDILTDDYGFKGLLWCINKYVYRYGNQRKEKDPLKIACYMFIIWIKFGLHQPGLLSFIKRVLSIWVNTTVDVKSKFFPLFMGKLRRSSLESLGEIVPTTREHALALLTERVRSLRNPVLRTEKALLSIFKLVERVWEIDGWDKAEHHETDTGSKKGN